MKQSVLGQPVHIYRKKLHRRIGLCVSAAVFTLGLNILLTALRTDTNHAFMLTANIVADILCGFFLLYDTQLHIRPQIRLYRLFTRQREQLTGTVTHISPQVQRYMDLDCYAVTVDERKVFLPAGTLELKLQTYTLFLVSNVIVEVGQ